MSDKDVLKSQNTNIEDVAELSDDMLNDVTGGLFKGTAYKRGNIGRMILAAQRMFGPKKEQEDRT